MDNIMYLVQREVQRGPREYAHAYEKTYVTVAVCDSKEMAAHVWAEETLAGRKGCLVVEAPRNSVFKAGSLKAVKDLHSALPAATRGKLEERAKPQALLSQEAAASFLSVSPSVYDADRRVRETELARRLHVTQRRRQAAK